MKRFVLVVFCFICVFSLHSWALENQDWIIRDDWYVVMDYRSPNHYDWHDYKTPLVTIRKIMLPAGSTLYRERLRKDNFSYYYQMEKAHVFFLGHDNDQDGKDDELEVHQRENYSYMFLVNKQGSPYVGGKKVGEQHIEEHPLVGIWGELPSLSELRLVEPANYVYYLEIDREIPSFAVRQDAYLLKQVGDKVFESDSSFSDGHIRLEIKGKQQLVFTPLFDLQDEKGFVEPFFIECGSTD
jgi:hypothetical protein